MSYIAHKFGGTSLSTPERITNLKNLLIGHNEIIIVSAIGDTTDILQELLDLAKIHKPYEDLLQKLSQQHEQLVKQLVLASQQTAILQSLAEDVVNLIGVLKAVTLVSSYSKEMQDLFLGYGERWSARIVAGYLANFSKTIYLDATQVLFTDPRSLSTGIDWHRSEQALNAFMSDHAKLEPSAIKPLVVITGFIAATQEGTATTLGRNGSDFSAAIFAKLFFATHLTIWTDVDGIYSADPRRVKSAVPLEFISYKEALELAYFGATVVHPKTIVLAGDCNIPVAIKNSLNPHAKGTLIDDKVHDTQFLIKGLSSIDEVALINVEGAGMIGVSGIAARVFQVMQQVKISVILISQVSSEYSICFAVHRNSAELAYQSLMDYFAFEIEQKHIEGIYLDENCAIIAAVGDGMIGTPGISGRLCQSLARANVNIRAIAQGSSERNISVVVNAHDVNKALRSVHSGFYLSNKSLAVAIIGPGNVGRTLINQITKARDTLRKKYNVDLRIRAIMNSKKILLIKDGDASIDHWQAMINESDVDANVDLLLEHLLLDDIPHAAVIDCTANQSVADLYPKILEQGVHIVTPNKRANSGDINLYHKIKSIQAHKNVQYLYETTVCAGLPVIGTLQDLIKTGDEVIQIEGIVSGTLAYIFDQLDQGAAFSNIIKEAHRLGYTEPDPRDDLSGMDVARKFVCLARELGENTLLTDLSVHNLVPEPLRDCSLTEFFDQLSNYDQPMAEFANKAKAENTKLGYVGRITADRKIIVDIQAYPRTHAFARMAGTDNMIIFKTTRYHTQALVIQGPGAGGEVTAAGVFADLLRLISSLG